MTIEEISAPYQRDGGWWVDYIGPVTKRDRYDNNTMRVDSI